MTGRGFRAARTWLLGALGQRADFSTGDVIVDVLGALMGVDGMAAIGDVGKRRVDRGHARFNRRGAGDFVPGHDVVEHVQRRGIEAIAGSLVNVHRVAGGAFGSAVLRQRESAASGHSDEGPVTR